MKAAVAASLFATGALADVGAWGQCGGQNWTGETTCVSGYTCVYSNAWYSQCLPGDSTPTTTNTAQSSSTMSTSTTSATSQPTGSSFKWFGVDESCAEFGQDYLPGVWGTHYTWPDTSTIATLMDEGMNTFRISFAMERLVSGSNVDGSLVPDYLANLTNTVNFVTERGGWAVLDPHNYGRFYGNIITDTNAFKSFWTKLAGEFKDNSLVVFDTNNEYHTMSQDLVLQLNQAAIDGIRASGATSQYIFVEGNQWSGAWSWNVTNTNMVALTDPQDMIVYEMHQYLDVDSSGTHEECVSTTVGRDRVVGATEWLRENGKKGIIGEYAGAANDVCYQAVEGLLDHLVENSDVWMGALFWAAGPWWGNYMYSYEPPSGTAYTYYNSLLKSYA